jgi:hypothetical protein
VHLRERAGAGPDAVGHELVVDVLAERDDLLDVAAGDERERGVSMAGDVGLAAADPELELFPREADEVGRGEELARRQATGEVEDRRAHHHRVVDVEERGGGEVGLRRLRGTLLGDVARGDRRGGRCLAGDAGPFRALVGFCFSYHVRPFRAVIQTFPA